MLETIRPYLPSGSFMVEDATGFRRYTAGMSEWELANGIEVPFEELSAHPATRVVVISPQHDEEEFLSIVERMGLHKVSYAIGWTAWLDIAPDGVNKATALERVRKGTGIPRSRVVAVGDGRNDIDMLLWAGAEGRAWRWVRRRMRSKRSRPRSPILWSRTVWRRFSTHCDQHF